MCWSEAFSRSLRHWKCQGSLPDPMAPHIVPRQAQWAELSAWMFLWDKVLQSPWPANARLLPIQLRTKARTLMPRNFGYFRPLHGRKPSQSNVLNASRSTSSISWTISNGWEKGDVPDPNKASLRGPTIVLQTLWVLDNLSLVGNQHTSVRMWSTSMALHCHTRFWQPTSAAHAAPDHAHIQLQTPAVNRLSKSLCWMSLENFEQVLVPLASHRPVSCHHHVGCSVLQLPNKGHKPAGATCRPPARPQHVVSNHPKRLDCEPSWPF